METGLRLSFGAVVIYTPPLYCSRDEGVHEGRDA